LRTTTTGHIHQGLLFLDWGWDLTQTHHVKSWSHFFDAIKAGHKKHDLRRDDRNYQAGDTVVLERYDNIKGIYTGEQCTAEISYITNNQFPCAFSSAVLPQDYCILSLEVVE
jgi:hypothetical protein